jgi:methyltransferase-like protein/SAM-dependent methyltransferase
MLPDPSTSYDELPYSDNCFPYTHPDHLASVATIHGLIPPPVRDCRVLELGCARGGNLIPMALGLPTGRFLGIDLSSRQIAEGNAVVQKIGLDNIELRALSITDISKETGQFDYIVCHGVYSWVPEPVRDKILAICAENLAPQGVAYVSYNTYPGWHERGMVREMMAYHVRATKEALDRVERARGFLDDLVRVLPVKTSSYARIVQNESEFLRGVSSTYVYHEHLEETNHPVYFHEFIGRARSNGLRFLAEARTFGLIDNLSPEARSAIKGWAKDADAREQYLDFLCNRTFRRTLLCHETAACRQPSLDELLTSMTISTGVRPVSSAPDVVSDAPEQFRRPEGAETVTTNNPLTKAALVTLYEAQCRSLPFEKLWDEVRFRLGARLDELAGEEEGRLNLGESLLRCFGSGLLDFHVHPPRFASEPGDRPLASPLARIQAEKEESVTNLRGRAVELDEFHRLVLRMLDGTRDLPRLIEDITSLFLTGEFKIEQEGQPVRDPALIEAMIGPEIEPTVRRLTGLALLIG